MSTPLEKTEIKLNQNLWLLIVALSALGASEYWKLPVLQKFSIYICWAVSISMTITLAFYTFNYCRAKVVKWLEKKSN